MAQKLKFGNGTWATKKGSTLAYNDENDRYKPLPFTTTRDSIATRVNKEGLIEVVGKDIPRIDYTDSSDGVLLLENSATNLVTYSEDFSNSAWTKGNTTITSDSLISPNGSLNASTLTDNTANTIHRLRDSISLSASTDYGLSIFAKKGTLSNIQLALINTANSHTASRVFDLENGVLGESITSGGTLSDSKITDYGNGWYRCEITSQFSSTPNTYQVTLATKSSGNSSTGNQVTYDGDGNGNVYLWGAQLEQGSYATSYIPTSGSTVQRAADTASGAGNSEVFNDSEGVLFADMSALADDGTVRSIALSDGTGINRINIRFRSQSNELSYSLFVSGETTKSMIHTVSDTRDFHKTAAYWKQDDLKFYVNGFLVDSINSANMLPSNTLNRLNFDSGAGLSDLYGKTKEIGYYDTALTDEELEYITSYRSLNELVTELNLNTL